MRPATLRNYKVCARGDADERQGRAAGDERFRPIDGCLHREETPRVMEDRGRERSEHYQDPKLEIELTELFNLRRLRYQLEPMARLFKHSAGACRGVCDRPREIIPTHGITCCNLYPTFRRYQEVYREEELKRRLVERMREGRK